MARVMRGTNRGGCGSGLTVNVDSMDFDSEDADSAKPTENLHSLVSLIEAHSTSPRIMVPRSDVPDVDQSKRLKKITGSSNLVFEFGEDKVVKYLEVKNEGPHGFKALILEVTCVTTEHPNWVEAIGLFLRGTYLCMVMPKMVVMSNFAQTMRAQKTPMPDKVLASMLCDWLQGLKALEERGKLHGDVKPANLLFDDPTSRGKLSDFGSVGEHNPVKKYTKIHGLPPEARCTLCYCLPRDVGKDETNVNSKFDSLSIGLSALQIALGDQHPVLALSELDGLPMEEKRNAFMNTFLAHPNLLQDLENEGKLKRINIVPLRTVLQQLTLANLDDRISPSKALELLATSVGDRKQVRDFVQGVLMPPKKAC